MARAHHKWNAWGDNTAVTAVSVSNWRRLALTSRVTGSTSAWQAAWQGIRVADRVARTSGDAALVVALLCQK